MLPIDSARECVQRWANVQKDEQVLILQDDASYAEPEVVNLFVSASKEVGADVTVVTCRAFNPRTGEPPKIVANALLATDAVFFMQREMALIHSKAARKGLLEYNLRIISVLTNTVKALNSEWARFPTEVLLAVAKKNAEVVAGGKKIRVRAENGTDIVGTLPPPVRYLYGVRAFCPATPGLGWHGIWPGEVGPCLEPISDSEGVIVLDVLPGFEGLLKKKVRITVENERIKNIEGGKEAEWFRRLVERKKAEGADSDLLYEIQWGVNPKADLSRALKNTAFDEGEISRAAGTIHFGFGSGRRNFHWDTVIVNHFDVEVDGKFTHRDGRVTALDDPEVRRLASKHGDPALLLSELSFKR